MTESDFTFKPIYFVSTYSVQIFNPLVTYLVYSCSYITAKCQSMFPLVLIKFAVEFVVLSYYGFNFH